MKFFRSLKYAVTAAAVCLLCFSGRSEYVFAVSSIDIENDLNGDGAVDINDIELLSEFLLGKHTDAVVGADTNHDGDINVFDLIKLKRIINNSGGYTGFITADGRILKDENGRQYIIKGMAFGNKVWDNPAEPPVNKHHTEESYEELADLGFNSVRFYLNYSLFENDASPYKYKESGFKWLDQNIEWAEKYGIRLVLNMHYPQGGYQSQGNGDELWTDTENQNRLIALWTEIARRYSDNPSVLGYGIVNEPVVSAKDYEDPLEKWRELAQDITDSIRTVDDNHLIFVERMCAAEDTATGNLQWENFNNDNNFIKINGDDIVYEFHYYDYHPFTHQGFDWAGTQGYDLTYPDESIAISTSGSSWEAATFDGDSADLKSEEWQYLESSLMTITEDNQKLLNLVFQAQNLGNDGIAYADNLKIDEYDENGKFVKTVYSEDFKNGNMFSFWSENNTGSGGKANIGYDDNASLCISGTTSDASFGRNNLLAVKGHSYKASGYFKVENAGQSAVVRPRVDVWSADEVSAFNKDFLEKSILNNIRFSIDNNVPVYCGEFGAGVNCFKNDRGGDRWVSDVIDVFIENDISFNYHTYHETGFGLYTDWNDLPTTLNEVLYELFKVKLTGIRSP